MISATVNSSLLWKYLHGVGLALHKVQIIRRTGKTLLMKRWLFVLLVAGGVGPPFVSAQDTAHKALRAVGAQRGEKALGQVVSIVGQSGRPQPVAWRITLDDPAARGGEREFDLVCRLLLEKKKEETTC